MLKKIATRSFALTAACAAASLASTGCRSMPGASMLGLRPKPTAEALAGSGPSTTYPVPPSHSATPQAIASVAGGTGAPKTDSGAPEPAMSDIAGFEISPGYALPGDENPSSGQSTPGNPSAPEKSASATPANLAAAQANGIYDGGVSATPATYKTSPTPTRQPSGYTFGEKALTPKPSTAATAKAEKTDKSGTDAKLASHSFAPPSGELTVPSTASEGLPKSSYSAAPSSQGGFTLPTDSPALSALTPPPTADENAVSASLSSDASDDTGVAAAADFSTASTAPPSGNGPSTPTSNRASGGQYTPGSTGAASGYPAGNTTPSTSGSFYR